MFILVLNQIQKIMILHLRQIYLILVHIYIMIYKIVWEVQVVLLQEDVQYHQNQHQNQSEVGDEYV